MAISTKHSTSVADLLRGAERQIRGCVPDGWSVEVEPGVPVGSGTVDAVVRIASAGGERASLAVDVRKQPPTPNVAEASALRLGASILEAGPDAADWGRIVVAPFIGPAARERLTQLGAGFVDLTGNVRLVAERPAIAITARGSDKPPRTPGATLAGMSGRAALQVARALVDVDIELPATTEMIAAAARTSVAQTWRVIELLQIEGIVTRDSRGRLAQYEWRPILMRLLQDYSFERRGRPTPYLTLQGPDKALQSLRSVNDADGRIAVTGARAAQEYAPLAPPRSLELWADAPATVAEAIGAVPADGAADLFIAAPFSEAIFNRTTQRDGIDYCAPSQTVADLWNGPGRSRQQAETILDWMARDDTWRS